MAFSVAYDFRLLDRFSGPLAKINSAMLKYNESVSKVNKKMTQLGGRMQKVGGQMANFNTAVGAAGATMAVKGLFGAAVQFEGALNKVQSVTWASTEQMKAMGNQAMKLGRDTQFSASQAAGAMTFLGTAGLNASEIMGVMPGMLKLAAAGSVELSDAADISTNILKMFGMELEQIGHLSDVLALSAAKSNTNVYQLAEAISNAGSSAHLAGLSLEETTSALMLLASSGIKGGEAGTQLMNALRALTSMTSKTAKSLHKLGIDPRKILDSKGQIKDFTGLVDQLGKRGATLGELFSIFDIRGAKAMAILKESGGKALSDFTDMLKNANGATQKMSDILMQGTPGAVKRFQSAWESVNITMGKYMAIILAPMLEGLANMFSHLQENHPWLLKLAAGGILLAAAIGLIIVPLGFMASSLGSIITIAPLVIGFFTKFGLITKIASAAQVVFNAVLAANPIGLILTAVASLITWFVFLYKKTGSATQAFKIMGQSIINFLLAPIRLLIESLGAVASYIPGLGDFAEGMQKYSEGLRVDFTGNASVNGAREASRDTMKNSTSSTQKVEVGGEIGVKAEPYTQITKNTLNVGGNRASAY